jgi:DNA-binding MarR family transcriptional regulator
MTEDSVDKILKQWQVARPDLDCSPMGVVGRLRRTSNVWKTQMDKVFKQEGLNSIEFDILATLRRCGQPEVTPTELYRTLMISSGAVSTKIEQLVQRGFVARVASEDDRRSCKVKLTDEGQDYIDGALNAHVANMETMIGVLSSKEQQQLAVLLKKIQLANT